MCRLSINLAASAFWSPKGLSRPVTGLLNLYFYLFSANRAVYEIMWKNLVQPDRPEMAI
jgi:hypothetical protein